MRFLLAALAALLLAGPAFAADAPFKTQPGGSEAVLSNQLNAADVAYSRPTATDTAYVRTGGCRYVSVVFVSDITNNATNNSTAEVYQCPAGSKLWSDAGCKQVLPTLTGSSAGGLDAIYGIETKVIAFKFNIAGAQTGQMQVLCQR